MTVTNKKPREMRLIRVFAVVVTLTILMLTACMNQQSQSGAAQISVLEDVQSSRQLTIGYAIYPPYIQKDLSSGELSGFSIDVGRELADQMGIQPIFVESTWDTFIADMKLGKFQLFVGPIYHSVKRLMEVDFPEPYGFFSAVAGLAKEDDSRFSQPMDLDKEGVVISVPQAWTSHEWVKRFLKKPKIKAFRGGDAGLVFSDLIAGNCDVALADAPTVEQYIEKNPNENVKPLFLDKPVSFVRAGFMVRKGDPTWLEFVSESVLVMRTEGTIRGLAQKYKLYSFEEEVHYIRQ